MIRQFPYFSNRTSAPWAGVRGCPRLPPPSSHPASSPNLVEEQGLADIAPTAGASSCCEQGRQQAHEKQGAPGCPWADKKHHKQAGGHAQQAGVPGEQAEGGAGVGREKEERKLRSGPEQGTATCSSPQSSPQCLSPSYLSSLLYSGDTGILISHRKLGAEAHSRLRHDRSTAA